MNTFSSNLFIYIIISEISVKFKYELRFNFMFEESVDSVKH